MKSRGLRVILVFVGAVAMLLALAGCSSLSARSIQYIGTPKYPPSDPAGIAILQTEPTQPHEKLGEVVIDTSLKPAPPVERIEAALRKGSAKFGADAVVVVHDQTRVTGAWVTGLYWGPWVSPIEQRLIIGICIRYIR